MTHPRSTLISLSDTPWYHVVSRCVRLAFLCGEDCFTGKNFDHRRAWLETWILQLAGVFAIDVAAYAVMSNHYHIVVRIDAMRAAEWSIEEILEHWTRLFTGPVIVQRYLSPETRALMTESECDKVVELGS
ncbi:transposase [Gammaproteobacteria bacterium]